MRWPFALRSSGTRSTRSWLASTMPHGCSAMCRGNPEIRSATEISSSICSNLQVDALEFGQAVDRLAQVARRDVRERLRDRAHLDLGQPERFAHLADRRARPVGVDHRDARGALGAVTAQDHVVDVFAPGGFDVDVDVGQVLAHRVHEPLERQVVAQRVDVGDADAGSTRANRRRCRGTRPGCPWPSRRRRSSATVRKYAANPMRRIIESSWCRRSRSASVSVMPRSWTPRQHAFGQQGIGAASFGRREVREVDPSQPQVERAASRRCRGSRRTGRDARRTARAIAGEASASPRRCARETLVSATGTMRRMHSSASATNASAGSQVANRVGGHGPHVHPLGEAQHRADLVARMPRSSRCSTPIEQPVATERLAERIEQARGAIDAPGDRGPPGVRPWTGDRDEPGGVRADLRRDRPTGRRVRPACARR